MAPVSVIIPTYNRRGMVREAIASVLAQRDARFELVVIDDGSADSTWDDFERLFACEARVRVERTANRGPAAARNRGGAGLRTAHRVPRLRRFVATVQARQLAFMREHPQLEICQTGELWLRDGHRRNPGRRHTKRAGDFFIDSLRTCLISPSAVI